MSRAEKWRTDYRLRRRRLTFELVFDSFVVVRVDRVFRHLAARARAIVVVAAARECRLLAAVAPLSSRLGAFDARSARLSTRLIAAASFRRAPSERRLLLLRVLAQSNNACNRAIASAQHFSIAPGIWSGLSSFALVSLARLLTTSGERLLGAPAAAFT